MNFMLQRNGLFNLKKCLYIIILLLIIGMDSNNYPPVIEYFGPKNGFSIPINSQMFIIECRARSKVPIKYHFLKNGIFLNENIQENTLIIANLNSYNNGVYTCVATNSDGSTLSNEYNLIIRILGHFIDRPLQIEAHLDQRLLIDCPRFSYSTFFNIRWVYQRTFMGFDSPLQLSSDTILQLANGSLLIPILEVKDVNAIEFGNGLICVLEPTREWSIETVKSEPITLKIRESQYTSKSNEYAPIIIDKHVDYKEVLKDESVVLKCLISSKPKSEITWYFNGELLIFDPYLYEIHNNLMISSVSMKHNGTYMCSAKNKLGVSNMTIILIIHTAPHYSSQVNNNITARLGYNKSLICPIYGIPQPMIEWYINSLKFDTDSKYGSPKSDGSIFIDAIQKDHSLYYQCIGRNSYGSLTYTINLTVKGEPPIILNNNKHFLIYRGFSNFLECKVDGAPLPSVEWFTNSGNKVQSFTTSQSGVYQKNSFIHFNNVDDSDTGEYICVAKNELGQTSYSIKVTVLNKTTITKHSQHMEVEENSNIELFCDVSFDKNLNLEIHWFFETNLLMPISNSNILIEKRVTDRAPYKLMITNIATSNSGTYTCKASTNIENGLKSIDSSTITVLVKGLLKPNVIAVDESDECDRLKIYFEKSPHINYETVVECSANIDNSFLWFECCRSSNLGSCDTHDLPPSLIIESIRAFYIVSNKNSSYSDVKVLKKCTTKGIAPRYNPIHITPISNSEDELSIEFQQLPCVEMQAENSGYNLTYWPNINDTSIEASSISTFIMHICQHELRVYKLPLTRNYKSWNYFILSINSFGSNKYDGKYLTSKIGIKKPTCKPSNLKIELINELYFNLTWDANDCINNETFTGYKVDLKIDDNSIDHFVTTKIYGEINLLPNRFYTIEISAYSFGGGSGSIISFNYRTPLSVPLPVQNLKYIIHGLGVHIMWNPLFYDGDITNYKTELRIDELLIDTTYLSGSSDHVYLDDLKPLTKYIYCIYSENTVGVSLPNCIQFLTSNDDGPFPPLPLLIRKCGHGCIIVQVVLGFYGGLPQEFILNITAHYSTGLVTGKIIQNFKDGTEIHVKNLVPATYFIAVSFKRNDHLTIPSPTVVYTIDEYYSSSYSLKTGVILVIIFIILSFGVLVAVLIYRRKFRRRIYSVRLRERLNENRIKTDKYMPIKESMSQNYAPIKKLSINNKVTNIYSDDNEFSEHALMRGTTSKTQTTFVGLYGNHS